MFLTETGEAYYFTPSSIVIGPDNVEFDNGEVDISRLYGITDANFVT